MSATQYYGTGRRKTSTARVFLQNGEGRSGDGEEERTRCCGQVEPGAD